LIAYIHTYFFAELPEHRSFTGRGGSHLSLSRERDLERERDRLLLRLLPHTRAGEETMTITLSTSRPESLQEAAKKVIIAYTLTPMNGSKRQLAPTPSEKSK